MNILSWDKPKRAVSVEEWKNISADSAPPGVYVPNMSDEDANRWKAKLVGAKTAAPRVEIRKTLRGTQLLIIVALDGWDYKHEYVTSQKSRWDVNTKGLNIRMSMNGPLLMTFAEHKEMSDAILEASATLQK